MGVARQACQGEAAELPVSPRAGRSLYFSRLKTERRFHSLRCPVDDDVQFSADSGIELILVARTLFSTRFDLGKPPMYTPCMFASTWPSRVNVAEKPPSRGLPRTSRRGF